MPGNRQRQLTPERWEEWSAHLASREFPASLRESTGTQKGSPLLWALPAEIQGGETESLLIRLDKLKPNSRASRKLAADLEQWLDAARGRKPSQRLGLESLAWCHALGMLSQILPAAPWCELLEHLTSMAGEANYAELAGDPLSQQLLSGELPLTLAHVLPELAAHKALAGRAREALSVGILELLDGEGMLNCKHLHIARPLFACWTRCGCLGRTMPRACFTSDAKNQYEWLVQQMLRLCRNDGTQVLSADAAGARSSSLFETALKLAGDADDREIASFLLPGRKAQGEPRPKLPSPAVHSEWGQTAVLRRQWKRNSDQLAVTYADRELALELNCGNETVFSGICNPRIVIGGELRELIKGWDEVCWLSDEDVDYLELEARYNGNLKVQRQILLARADRLLFIADAVLGEDLADIQYSNTLPLQPGLTFQPAEETREGVLSNRQRLGLVMPLQLPEWKDERADGLVEQTSEGLELRQTARGQRLFAPLFIDLDARRFSRQLTWRRLTVAERLETVRDDVAVGYRVQIAEQQWLIYRSLGPIGNRTLLGANYSSEFVFGRFTREGEIEKLIEIE
jgi:hypothetical protein